MITLHKSTKAGIAAFALLLAACSDSSESTPHIGYVEAEWVYISASQSGWITQRTVSEGDRIDVDDILFELDKENQVAAIAEADSRIAQSIAEVFNLSSGARPAEIRALEAKLADAQARLELANSERDRILPLVERGAESSNRGEQVVANYAMALAAVTATTEEIDVAMLAGRTGVRDAATAGLQIAQTAKASAQIKLKERTITARVAGKVEQAFHHAGEYISAGMPVLAVLPTDGLKIKFFVSQAELPSLTLGKIVQAKADGQSEPVAAEVTFIATEAEFTPPVIYSNNAREKLVFLIEATAPADSGFHPGLPVDVDWL